MIKSVLVGAAKELYDKGMLKLNGTMRLDKGTAYRLLMRAAELGSQDAKVTETQTNNK